MSNHFTIITLMLTKKNYDNKNVKDEEKRGRDNKLYNGYQGPKSTRKKRLGQKKLMKYKNHYGLK